MKSLTTSQTVGLAVNEYTTGWSGEQFLGGTCTLALPTKGASSANISEGNGSYDVSVAIG